LAFSDAGVPKVIATIQVVGTTSPSSNTWLRRWDNDSLPECVKSRIREVRAFGVKNGVPELTEAALPDDEYLGWAMPVDLFSFFVEVITSQPRETLAARQGIVIC
jgi:hypothetical protein